jgi:alkylhydroperoxidase family enzyme
MTWAMANSPALLQGYLDLSGALGRGVLRPATRERIALAVAQRNNCS